MPGSFDSKTKSLGRGIRELRGCDLTQAQFARRIVLLWVIFQESSGEKGTEFIYALEGFALAAAGESSCHRQGSSRTLRWPHDL